MRIAIRFLSAFQDLTEGRKIFTVDGDRLISALRDLERRIPALQGKLLLSDGTIHPAYHSILVRRGRQLLCQDPDHSLEDGDEIVIAPVISGG